MLADCGITGVDFDPSNDAFVTKRNLAIQAALAKWDSDRPDLVRAKLISENLEKYLVQAMKAKHPNPDSKAQQQSQNVGGGKEGSLFFSPFFRLVLRRSRLHEVPR